MKFFLILVACVSVPLASCSGGGSSGTQPPPPQAVQVTVSPVSASVEIGKTKQFTAIVTGTSNAAVTWSVSGQGCSGAACGAIDGSGLYTAPAAVPSPATVSVRATSAADSAASASAAVTITSSALADFSVSVPAAVTVAANGSANVPVAVSVSGSGSASFTVSVGFGPLPQGVSVAPPSQDISAGSSFSFAMSATKDAPAASGVSVTVTGTRASDGVSRSAAFPLTVTRIALGGGNITYTPDDSNGLFPPASQTCFTNFAGFLEPLRDTLFGAPDTMNLGVSVKVDPSVGGVFQVMQDTMLLGAAPDCTFSTQGVLGTFAHEDGHASHRTWLRLQTVFPPLDAYREEGAANALSVVESRWAAANGWLAAPTHLDAILDIHLLNQLAPELVAAAGEGAHADPVANSLWMHAATALHLEAIFAGSTGPSGNISQWNSLMKRWNEGRYAFVNTNQRLPSETEDDQLLAAAMGSAKIDGEDPLAWLSTQVITAPLSSLQNAKTFVGLLFRPAINPPYVDVPIVVRDASGNESTVTTGTATLSVFAKDGITKACQDAMLDLSQTHEYPFACKNASGNSVQLPEDVYLATASATISGKLYTASAYFVAATTDGETVSGWPGVYLITRDQNGQITDATVTTLDGSLVKRLAAGLFLLTPNTTQLPLQVAVQASTQTATVNATFTVPPLAWWTTVGIVDIK